MARTILKDKTALVLGVENAPGRACAQQLAREGARVILASTDEGKLGRLAAQLAAKNATTLELALVRNSDHWADQLIETRRQVQHIHVVVNALALSTPDNEDPLGVVKAGENALRAERILAEDLLPRGPVKSLLLWPGDVESPPAPEGEWRCVVRLGAHQRTDEEDTAGNVLRAGSIGDCVVSLTAFPASACPKTVDLVAIRATKG